MTKILEVKELQASYGEMRVLWNLSLEVNKKGEIVCLLGSNGAGKTTTLRVISGLVPPQREKGTVHFLGEDITNVEPHKRVEKGIAHIPEGRKLFPDLTVLENLKAAAYTKMARENIKDSLETVYSLFPILKERKNQLAKTLSGGEQQMLAIARGLMLRPKLLMFDEPSLGLAPKIVQKIFELIKYLAEQGYAVLLVEQNVRQSLMIGDRAYVLENGRIIKSGLCEELMEDPEIKRAYLGI